MSDIIIPDLTMFSLDSDDDGISVSDSSSSSSSSSSHDSNDDIEDGGDVGGDCPVVDLGGDCGYSNDWDFIFRPKSQFKKSIAKPKKSPFNLFTSVVRKVGESRHVNLLAIAPPPEKTRDDKIREYKIAIEASTYKDYADSYSVAIVDMQNGKPFSADHIEAIQKVLKAIGK